MGQQLRMVARRPAFALLDEATSGVAPAVVEAVYRELGERGTTVVTFTRELGPGLADLHEQQLHLGEPTATGWKLVDTPRSDHGGVHFHWVD